MRPREVVSATLLTVGLTGGMTAIGEGAISWMEHIKSVRVTHEVAAANLAFNACAGFDLPTRYENFSTNQVFDLPTKAEFMEKRKPVASTK